MYSPKGQVQLCGENTHSTTFQLPSAIQSDFVSQQPDSGLWIHTEGQLLPLMCLDLRGNEERRSHQAQTSKGNFSSGCLSQRHQVPIK